MFSNSQCYLLYKMTASLNLKTSQIWWVTFVFIPQKEKKILENSFCSNKRENISQTRPNQHLVAQS